MTMTPETKELHQLLQDARLHAYLAWGCPFCHRVFAALVLTGLQNKISISWMENIKGPAGWKLAPKTDPLYAEDSLKKIYQRLDPDSEHRPSVPLLVDLSSKQLVSTSSKDITRLITTGLNGRHATNCDLVPANLIDAIDRSNAWLHTNINRAVYQVGFSSETSEYEVKVARLFRSLDELERQLSARPFLLGNVLTESDIFLLATLVRFDNVYYPLFRCNVRRIADYPALSDYLARLKAIEGMSETFDPDLIVEHYFQSVIHVGGQLRRLHPGQ